MTQRPDRIDMPGGDNFPAQFLVRASPIRDSIDDKRTNGKLTACFIH
jgi:hypothetical protein